MTVVCSILHDGLLDGMLLFRQRGLDFESSIFYRHLDERLCIVVDPPGNSCRKGGAFRYHTSLSISIVIYIASFTW